MINQQPSSSDIINAVFQQVLPFKKNKTLAVFIHPSDELTVDKSMLLPGIELRVFNGCEPGKIIVGDKDIFN